MTAATSNARLRRAGRTVRIAACVALTAAFCAGSGRAEAAEGPDAWVGQWALQRLSRSEPAELPALHAEVEDLLLSRAACGHFEHLGAIADLVYVWRASETLPRAAEVGGESFAAWLRDHPTVLRRFLRASDSRGGPVAGGKATPVERLAELYAHDAKRVAAYPELSAAFAIACPERPNVPPGAEPPDRASLTESFDYYTDGERSFRYDLREMPYELALHLACSRLSMAERNWAYGRYRRHRNPPKAYFDLEYDYGHYRSGRAKKITEHSFTLPELLEHGGVCIEQAYYAAEVCRALGIPAAIVTGKGRTGGGHAWVAALRLKRGAHAVWDARTGRYSAHLYYSGDARDPATGEHICDAELTLAGMATGLALRRRQQADAAATLAKLWRARAGASGAEPLAPMRELVERYEESHEDASPRTEWIPTDEPRTEGVACDLLASAIEHNVALGRAWEQVIALRKDGELPSRQLYRFLDLLVQRTAKSFPDYSCDIVMRLAPTIPDPEDRIDFYRRAMRCFGRRPDLAGRILLATGDQWLRAEDRAKALQAYGQAARKGRNVADVVLTSAAKAEELLAGDGRDKQVVAMYHQLLRLVPRPQDSAFAKYTVYYKLTERLAEIYQRLGHVEQAERLLERLK
ncbi:MAG: transglutaminase domain-containing protein [Planctomycetota bacterium]